MARISRHIALEIDRLRTTAGLLLSHHAASPQDAVLRRLLSDLDEIPRTYAESFLLQALGVTANRLRMIERSTRAGAGAADQPRPVA